MQNEDRNQTDRWVQLPTTTAFEAGFQNRIIRAVLQEGELWLSIADACAALDLPNLPEELHRLDPEKMGLVVVQTAGIECRLDIVDAWEVGWIAAEADTPIGNAFVHWLAKLLATAYRTGHLKAYLRGDGGAVRVKTTEPSRLAFEKAGGRVVMTRLLWEEDAGLPRPVLLIRPPDWKPSMT